MTAWRASANSLPLQIVLIVADGPEAAGLWSQLFIEKGCNVVVENAAQAVYAARILNPQLVLADLNLPHADRLALCRTLKLVSGAALMVVIPPRPQEIIESYAAGVDECLAQPINPALALVKGMAWIMRRQLPRPHRFALEAPL